MNSVSLFVYFASVVAKLNILLDVITVAYTFSAVVVLLVSIVALEGDLDEGFFKSAYGRYIKMWWVFAIVAVFSTLVPSEKALYMIAASEIGETVVTTPEAKQIADDLTTILRNYAKESLTTSN